MAYKTLTTQDGGQFIAQVSGGIGEDNTLIFSKVIKSSDWFKKHGKPVEDVVILDQQNRVLRSSDGAEISYH